MSHDSTLISLAFIFLCPSLLSRVSSEFIDIPGCPSLYLYNSSQPVAADEYAPTCFCDNSTETSDVLVQVNCLYFSTLRDLSDSLRRVVKANKVVAEVYLEHMIFGKDGLPDDYFRQHNVAPSLISVTNCDADGTDVLLLRNRTFQGLERNLTKLIIKNCAVKSFPDSVRRLAMLESLTLQQTAIRSIKLEDLSALTKLEYLDLSANKLKSIEDQTFRALPKLKFLHLGPENLLDSSIFAQINQSLPDLEELDLSGNNISHLSPSFLSNLRKLRSLNLANNNLLSIHNSSFKGLSALRSLDLRVNLINYTESGAFEDLLSLTDLYLAGNYLTTLEHLNLPELVFLDAGYNNFDSIDGEQLKRLPKLRELDLRKNDQLTTISDSAFARTPNLHSLNLSYTNISSIEARIFANTRDLLTLDISNTRITSIDASIFAQIRKLEHLSLASTKLQSLPENAFDSLSQLKSLDLSGNNWICDASTTWLGKWIVDKTRSAHPVDFPSLNDVLCSTPDGLRQKPVVRTFDPHFPLENTTTTQAPTLAPTTSFTNETINSTLSLNSTVAKNNSYINATASTNIAAPPPEAVGGGVKEQADDGNKTRVTIIVAVVVVLAACATIAVVAIIVFTMKRRHRKSSRLAALRSFVPSSSSPGIEMCQRPESTRISDIDLSKGTYVHNNNNGGSSTLYKDVGAARQSKENFDEKDAQNNNRSRDSPPLPPPPPPPPPPPQL